MRLSRGVLYEHAKRPEWGHGLFVANADAGKIKLMFTSGGVRTLLDASHLREVGKPPKRAQPKRDPARVRRPSFAAWTEAEDAKIRDLAHAGASDRELAEALPGRTRTACRQRRLRLGVVQPSAWTPERIGEAVRMREAGLTCPEIGAKLGRTPDAIRHLFAKIPEIKSTRRRYRAWTVDEDATIEATRHLSPALAAEALPGRSPDAVCWRRCHLKARPS